MLQFVLAVSALTALPASAVAGIEPTATDRSAFATGQLMQREIDVFQNPGICGIVLERSRCVADFPAPPPGADTQARAFAAFALSGDLDLYDQKWGDANATLVPEAAWKTNPRNAWLEDAGIVSILGRWPRNPITDLFDGASLDDLARRAATAGPYATLIPSAYSEAALRAKPGEEQLTLDQVASLRDVLLPELDALFPTAPYPAPRLVDGVWGDVRLGIYASTAQELFDSPIGLSEPASRNFVALFLDRLSDLSGTAEKPVVARLRAQIMQPFSDPRVNDSQIQAFRKDLQDVVDTLIATWPTARKQTFLLGLLTAQAAYNAAVLKDKKSDAQFRGAVATLPLPPGAGPSAGDDFRAMGGAANGDWRAVGAAATRATLDLLHGGP